MIRSSVQESQNRFLISKKLDENIESSENAIPNCVQNNHYLNLLATDKNESYKLFYMDDQIELSHTVYMEFISSMFLGTLYPRFAIFLTGLRTCQLSTSVY